MSGIDWPGAAPYVLGDGETRSISAENPTGRRSGGALAAPGDDAHCTSAARKLGKGWKVRPCLHNVEPGQQIMIADVTGPGVVQHIWCTVDAQRLADLRLRICYDEEQIPAIEAPLGFFFANGVNGIARVVSIPTAVNPRGGMNSYWPMPFRKRLRIEIENVGHETIKEFFYHVTYALRNVEAEAAYLRCEYREAITPVEKPEHVIIDRVTGDGQYVGTYLVWQQFAPLWWGEGEIKFFIDGDPDEAPTICGTGTEDYFGGAWGFLDEPVSDQRAATFTGPFLGYPQIVEKDAPVPDSDNEKKKILHHALYRWHWPDPIRFHRDLRVTIQALGWWTDGTYRPLHDRLASLAYWYQRPTQQC